MQARAREPPVDFIGSLSLLDAESGSRKQSKREAEHAGDARAVVLSAVSYKNLLTEFYCLTEI